MFAYPTYGAVNRFNIYIYSPEIGYDLCVKQKPIKNILVLGWQRQHYRNFDEVHKVKVVRTFINHS